MCVVTFLPLQKDGFILCSNRDENPNRPTSAEVQQYTRYGKEILHPVDEESKGSWIATSRQTTVCLLNGGFKKHERKLPYRKSRGLVVMDFFEQENIDQFVSKYSFENIEPFTLIVIQHNPLFVSLLVWDSQVVHRFEVDCGVAQLWCSATLYDEAKCMKRKSWFDNWLVSTKNYSAERLMQFHCFGGSTSTQETIRIQRNLVETVSISCIERKENAVKFTYMDLLKNTVSDKTLLD